MEELLTKHSKENRDLQSRITQKKKGATKKTRKGVNDECNRLEAKLKEKNASEIAALNLSAADEVEENEEEEEELDESIDNNPSANDTTNLSLAESAKDNTNGDTNNSPQPKKLHRQKARLAARAAELARKQHEAEVEAQSLPDMRAHERQVMEQAFAERGFVEREIRPDGHCLYSAVADQLNAHGRSLLLQDSVKTTSSKKQDKAAKDGRSLKGAYRIVRNVAADSLIEHMAYFEPFLEREEDDGIDDYLHKVRDTAEWGGQVELMALARAYNTKICIVQGDGSVTEITNKYRRAAKSENVEVEEENEPIWLAYYRHGYGLGEHYNSLRKGQKTKGPKKLSNIQFA